MNRISPVVRIAVGLVSLTLFVLLLTDFGFHVFRDDTDTAREVRERTSENLAVQLTSLIQKSDYATLQRTMDEVVRRTHDVQSMGVRRAGGEVVAESAGHVERWRTTVGEKSTLTQVQVPVFAGTERWGQIEIGYRPATPQTWREWLAQPTVIAIISVMLGGFALYWWFVGRVLQQLDPSKAIPDRVRKALDSLTEGVMLLDGKGRLVLANQAWHELHGEPDAKLLGRRASEIAWLRAAFADVEAEGHPWSLAMNEKITVTGAMIEIHRPVGGPRKAVVGAAPIMDGQGKVRGCLVNFNDVTAHDRANHELRAAMTEVKEARLKLERANQELTKLANFDPLTGVMNRRAFFGRAEEIFKQTVKTGGTLCVILSDIDKFKSFNDTYGHATGDLVLQHVARTLQAGLRPTDFLCRYGGEEFCIVLPGTPAAQAKIIAERIRFAVETQCGANVRTITGLKVTSSFGIAAWEPGAASIEELIDRADQALYAAKDAGRNRVLSYEELAAAPKRVPGSQAGVRIGRR